MSKWRPTKDGCLYVIPDIHGRYHELELILKRILPLRKRDKLIFLGDYVDRGSHSYQVIDRLAGLQTEYKDRVVCLIGNHELMLLQGLGFIETPSESFAETQYDIWTGNGAYQTIHSYMLKAGMSDANPLLLNRSRVKGLFPKEHIDFLCNLKAYYEEGNFVFIHGGCHPNQSPSDYSVDVLTWDRSLCKLVRRLIDTNQPMTWEHTIVTGHNASLKPVVSDKFLMLDCGMQQLLAVELNSREAFTARLGKARLLKYELKDTKPSIKSKRPGIVRRVTQ